MKYRIQYIGLMAAALAVSACSSDDTLTTQPQPVAGEGETIGFNSVIGDQLEILATENLDGNADAATRSTMDEENGQFETWSTTDKISISDGALMYTYLPKEGTIDGANCSFQSKTSASFVTDGGGSEGTFYAFYPADAVLGWNGTTVTTMIYTEQKYEENKEGGLMGPYMAAIAETTDGGANAEFTFGHVCSVIDVDFSGLESATNEVVDAVSLYANSKVSIAGRMAFNVNTKAATVSSNDGTGYSYSTQSEMIRVSEIAANASFVRFYVLPVAQGDGFTITVHTTSGNYYTKSSPTAVGTSPVNADYLASIAGVATSASSGSVCKPYYKKYNFKNTTNARTQNWMAMIPGNIKFSFLSTPGSHNSATSSGDAGNSSYAKCQSETIEQQLANGVRAFDLRPQYQSNSTITADNLTIYHGTYSTGVKYKDAIKTITEFLDANPTEAISIIMTKESASGSDQTTSNLIPAVTEIHNTYSSYFKVLDGSNYNLNDYRGKIFYGCRPDWYNIPGAVRVTKWPDDNSVTNYGVGVGDQCSASVEDAYNSTGNTKKSAVNALLDLASANTNSSRLHYTFTSVAFSLGVSITGQANTQNPAAATYITGTLTGPTGYVYGDFMGSSSYSGKTLLDAVINQNYKYVYKNRTRCSTTAPSGTDTGADISADEYADDGTVYVKEKTF